MLKTNKVIFVQISDEITATEDSCRRYYDVVQEYWYNTKPPRHYMEIPYWIPLCAGYLTHDYRQELYIVTSLEDAVEYFYSMPDAVLLFSVLDINKTVVKALVNRVWNTCILGGYLTPAEREEFKNELNVIWLDSPADLSTFLKTRPADKIKPDYALFWGTRTIPRLTLSRGCLYNCAFCTIPRVLETLPHEEIMQQILPMLVLDFEYVYIDDKTFGQADNYAALLDVYGLLKHHKPNFQGFIVQTTVPMALKLLRRGEIERLHIKALEVGVEIPDDDYLKKMRKPYRVWQLSELHAELQYHPRLIFIPNIIFGAPGDNYADTLHYLEERYNDIAFINPYVLTLYGTAKGEMGIVSESSRYDVDETTVVKSWLSLREQKLTQAVLDYCLDMYSSKAQRLAMVQP